MNWDGADVSFGDQGQRTAEEADDREVDTGINGMGQRSVEESVDACVETTVECGCGGTYRGWGRSYQERRGNPGRYRDGTTVEGDQEEEAVDTSVDTMVEGEAEATIDTGVGTTVEGDVEEADQPRRQTMRFQMK
ncbi:hypothetical protein Fot_32271 [Forsythia ovata]|uniref:Uncharacterized protein n=1 Tax=Forsythia ovata TaxID=205694 RepID=A0ABD1T7B6_9LAMI